MIVGFTGTREGMTDAQKATVRKLFVGLNAVSIRHGDCVGADKQASEIADELDIPVDLHPPADPRKRAFCNELYSNIIRVLPPKPYLERDEDLVDQSDALVAAPKEFKNKSRSGTWYTTRYALRTYHNPQAQVWIVLPDGEVVHNLP